MRTLVVWVEHPTTGHGMRVNALLDDGCTSAALISRELAEEMRLKGDPITARTEGVGGQVMEYKTIVAPLSVKPAGGGEAVILPAQVLERPAGAYQPVDWTRHAKDFEHLKRVPLRRPLPGGVQLLIGNRMPSLTLALEEVLGGQDEPVARRTPLGWTVIGPAARHDAGRNEAALLLQDRHETNPLPQRGVAMQNWRAALCAAETRRRALPPEQSFTNIDTSMPTEDRLESDLETATSDA